MCGTTACRAYPNLSLDFDPPEPELALEGQASGRAWLRPGIRVGLYSDALAYAEASGRLFLQGDLWGYLGNSCGDADGDGHNEGVGGATTDLSMGFDVLLELSIFGSNRSWTVYGWERPLAFYALDFPDLASPLEPFIEAENPAAQALPLQVGETGEWRVKMRPCYPYPDAVAVDVEPAIGSGTLTVPPREGKVAALRFDRPGTYRYEFTALRDEKDRTLGTSRQLIVEVVP